ncbi:MAG: ATP synthase F1 subunit delta [bacterium]
MKETILARRYARALFELARERDILESIRNEVALFNQNLQSSPSFRHFLNSPQLNPGEKQKVVEDLFQDRVSNVFFNFVLVLLKKNRQGLFAVIVKEFQTLFDQYKRKLRAATITAVPLDDATKSKLTETLSRTFDSDVQIENRIDPRILGGIVVNLDGQVFDGSLQSLLRRLKNELSQRTNSKMV